MSCSLVDKKYGFVGQLGGGGRLNRSLLYVASSGQRSDETGLCTWRFHVQVQRIRPK